MHVEAIAFHQALASASRNTNDMGLRLIRVQREMATLLKGRRLRDARRDSSLLRHLILAVGEKLIKLCPKDLIGRHTRRVLSRIKTTTLVFSSDG